MCWKQTWKEESHCSVTSPQNLLTSAMYSDQRFENKRLSEKQKDLVSNNNHNHNHNKLSGGNFLHLAIKYAILRGILYPNKCMFAVGPRAIDFRYFIHFTSFLLCVSDSHWCGSLPPTLVPTVPSFYLFPIKVSLLYFHDKIHPVF